MSAAPPIVLSFAATDPTGGAGLQADLLTLASLGCHPATVVTGVTAQDTRGVESIRALAAAEIEQQARLIFADMPVAAVKLGVLGAARNAEAIAMLLAAHPTLPVVMDPVLASGRGDPLADTASIESWRKHLLPRV